MYLSHATRIGTVHIRHIAPHIAPSVQCSATVPGTWDVEVEQVTNTCTVLMSGIVLASERCSRATLLYAKSTSACHSTRPWQQLTLLALHEIKAGAIRNKGSRVGDSKVASTGAGSHTGQFHASDVLRDACDVGIVLLAVEQDSMLR